MKVFSASNLFPDISISEDVIVLPPVDIHFHQPIKPAAPEPFISGAINFCSQETRITAASNQ